MFTKTIKYTDYDGNEREEAFLFNYTKAEILEMEMSYDGGFEKLLRKIIMTQDVPKVTEYFKKLILEAYGEKSMDGKRFVKSKELATAFSQTEAYSNLFIELTTNANSATEFINALLPAKLMDEIREAFEKGQKESGGVTNSPNLLPVTPN